MKARKNFRIYVNKISKKVKGRLRSVCCTFYHPAEYKLCHLKPGYISSEMWNKIDLLDFSFHRAVFEKTL